MPKINRGGSRRKVTSQYEVNSLCFAKVRGHITWPGRIIEKKSGKVYKVHFFGTYDTANVKSDFIYLYNEENIIKYDKQKPIGKFKMAMAEIKRASEGYYAYDQDSVMGPDDASYAIFFDTREEDPNPRPLVSVKYDANNVRDLLDEGEPMDPTERKMLELKEDKTEEETEKLRLAVVNDIFQEKVKFYTLETFLKENVQNLQICLATDKPYLGQGLEIIKEISKFPFDPVLLKKVPELFSVLDKCQKYDGVYGVSDTSREEIHRSKVEEIREKSEQVISKLLETLQIQTNSDYAPEVLRQMNTFKERTRHLTETERMLLTSENELM